MPLHKRYKSRISRHSGGDEQLRPMPNKTLAIDTSTQSLLTATAYQGSSTERVFSNLHRNVAQSQRQVATQLSAAAAPTVRLCRLRRAGCYAISKLHASSRRGNKSGCPARANRRAPVRFWVVGSAVGSGWGVWRVTASLFDRTTSGRGTG